jgi:hypothetical protein
LDVEEAEDAAPADGAGPKKKGFPTWVWLAGGGVGLLLLCGCGGGITALLMNMGGGVSKANYDKITKDMTEADVKKLLGTPTMTGDEAAKQIGMTLPKDQNILVWRSGDDFISVSIVKDKAVAKSCKIGPLTQTEPLLSSGGAGGAGGAVTMDNYGKIKSNMTEDDVKKILGEPTLSGDDAAKVLGMPLSGDQKILSWTSGGDFITVVFTKGKTFNKVCSVGGKTKQDLLGKPGG